jgi:endo-1,3(4)-beta-glucanase
MARLALIADEFQQTDIASSIRENMKKSIVPWLTSANSDPLQYDITYGGVCTLQGLQNQGADFGNGYYNDHRN